MLVLGLTSSLLTIIIVVVVVILLLGLLGPGRRYY